MARTTSKEALDIKIKKAQELVSKTKKQYDAAMANLSDLLDKREALQKDELMKAITRSKRTYEEVMAFLDAGDESEAD